jgi:hypothetical protein
MFSIHEVLFCLPVDELDSLVRIQSVEWQAYSPGIRKSSISIAESLGIACICISAMKSACSAGGCIDIKEVSTAASSSSIGRSLAFYAVKISDSMQSFTVSERSNRRGA